MQTELPGLILGAFLAVVGLTHFIIPKYFVRLVPQWIPHARAIVFATGIAELIIAVLIFLPQSRAVRAWLAAALITGYLVSHFDALARSLNFPSTDPLFGLPGTIARVVVNLFYIAWAVWVAVSA